MPDVFACFDCRNLTRFVQVSARADARELTMSTHGLNTGTWELADARVPGVYCAECGKALDVELDDLMDTRVEYVAPADFRAGTVAEELRALRSDAEWSTLEIPGRSERTAALSASIDPAILAALERTGRLPLYSHQVQAIESALRGEHVIQATAAGSGKSLGFTVPVLDHLVGTATATALFVFPLKALANDQMANLGRLGVRDDPRVGETMLDLDLGVGSPVRVARYDGSTPDFEKKDIRKSARLLITTPDSLHASVLRMTTRTYADKSSWERFLRGLRYVVLDEIHAYQGVFGSNVAQVLRRLRRAVAWHGGSLQFLTASATIGNPVELAERLTGVGPFTLVDDDGSPQRPRIVLVCNPPEQTEQSAKKAKTQKGTTDPPGRIAPQTVALELVAAGALGSEQHLPIRAICFSRSRGEVFALTKRIQNRLTALYRPELAAMVTSYAATLLADDRVEAEGSLRDGSLLAVVSTNALELGIDIPDLSIAVLCGYPGQISSFRQRAGRCGRAGDGLVVLVVGDDPLQQHLARRPEALQELLSGRAEDVVINPDAPEVLRRYGLLAAEADLGGIAFEDSEFFGEEAVNAWLADANGAPAVTHEDRPYWRVSPPDEEFDYPGLRSASGQRQYTVLVAGGGTRQPIGVLDAGSGPRDAFGGAIWTGAGSALYRVSGFDHKAREIYCEGPVNVDYLTRGIPVDTVDVLEEIEPRRTIGGCVAGYSDLRIRRNVFSYKQMFFSGAEQNHTIDRRWPETEFFTEGIHLHLPEEWFAGLEDRQGAVKAAEHVLLATAPAVVACDPYDIDATSDQHSVFIYDSFGAGIAITRASYLRLGEVVGLARDTVRDCPCSDGCPGCIVLSRRPDGNRDLSKDGALVLLEYLADGLAV